MSRSGMPARRQKGPDYGTRSTGKPGRGGAAPNLAETPEAIGPKQPSKASRDERIPRFLADLPQWEPK